MLQQNGIKGRDSVIRIATFYMKTFLTKLARSPCELVNKRCISRSYWNHQTL